MNRIYKKKISANLNMSKKIVDTLHRIGDNCPMQVRLDENAAKLVEAYKETLRVKVSNALIVNDVIIEALSKVIKGQQPRKKSK